ncbi:hypothetical protein SISNIDRAFT_401513, partial [Sistotremastrum niveocremeum HHB9708]
ENLADAIWRSLKDYGLSEKLQCVVSDNASNNDTMMQHLELMAKEEGISIDAITQRIRCMPHTIHLSALKLLEAIGATKS